MSEEVWTGGCLCGAFRYRAQGRPMYEGLCYCADCRRASGGTGIGFLGFRAEAISFSGETVSFTSPSASGKDADRSRCVSCGSLVMGGRQGLDEVYNLYAGSLDEPTRFSPRIAIFVRDRPDWAALPEGVLTFEGMPPQG